jgi:hypothetical protein
LQDLANPCSIKGGKQRKLGNLPAASLSILFSICGTELVVFILPVWKSHKQTRNASHCLLDWMTQPHGYFMMSLVGYLRLILFLLDTFEVDL